LDPGDAGVPPAAAAGAGRAVGPLRQIWHFVVHLRAPYQIAVVSGVYLLGGLYQPVLDVGSFFVQFVNVHLLLLGGATAYNSVCDRDVGPVGGLRRPPPAPSWARAASFGLQFVGMLLGVLAGPGFVAVYLTSAMLFWLYSASRTRWKGHPHKSLVVVALGNGVALLLLGYLAAGREPPRPAVGAASLGAALVLLSLYPASQVYQMAEDARRGDRTFAVRYGLVGVRRCFLACYPPGVLLLAGTLAIERRWLGAGVLMAAGLAAAFAWRALQGLRGDVSDYGAVTRLEYATSGLFVTVIVAGLVIVHGWRG